MNIFYKALPVLLALMLSVIIMTSCDSKKATGPSDRETTSINVLVKDDLGRPVVGGTLYTNPQTTEAVTDNEGKAVLENIEVRDYTILLRRNGFPTYTTKVTPDVANPQELLFVIISESPSVSVLYPSRDTFLSTESVTLSGTARDPEDGDLPDSAYVWSSNIDGELGAGPSISPVGMSLGQHQITLEATDSDTKTSTASVLVTIASFSADSYFPLFENASWIYRHNTAKFSFRNEDDYLENWELSDISVLFNDNVRTSSIVYNVVIGGTSKEYHYVVQDYINFVGDDIYVEKTVEDIKIWNGNPYGNPKDELILTTEYSPHFLMIPSVNNVPENFSQTVTHNISTAWTYNDQFFDEREKTENFNRVAVLTTGERETITANYKKFEAIQITLSIDGLVRKWQLTQGIGLVSQTYNAFDSAIPPVADMVTTNLSVMTAKGLVSAKASSFEGAMSAPVRLDLGDIPSEDSKERIDKLLDLFRMQAMR